MATSDSAVGCLLDLTDVRGSWSWLSKLGGGPGCLSIDELLENAEHSLVSAESLANDEVQ
jgi:hypothetical protein